MRQYPIARVAIVHRDGLYRDSLTCALTQCEEISVVSSLSQLEDLRLDLMTTSHPDLAILEYGLCCCHEPSNLNGIPQLPIGVKAIAVGVPDKDEDILACIEGLGVVGYVALDASLEDLIQNIRAVMRGETLCSARIASLAFERVSALARQAETSRAMASAVMGLTRREMEITKLIDDGLSNKEIATRLNIGVSTVKNHIHNILEKLQLHDRYSVVRYIKEHTAPAGPF